MGIGASPPQRPTHRPSRAGRAAFLLLVALVGVLAWLYVWPPAGEPFGGGPVVVVGGGGGERLITALEIVGEPAPGRELVLSEGASSEWERMGRSCREEDVRCFEPEPGNTFGEARTFARIAEERGWRRATVVTSEYHVTRTRMYFRSCLDGEVRVVAADSGWRVFTRMVRAHHEILGTLVGLGALPHC